MKLIKPKIEFLCMTPNPLETIERAARVCYRSESKNKDGAKKLVSFLVEHGHESMLEHVNASYKVTTNRGVSHEIVRHRIGSYAQESTRYVDYQNLGMEFVEPEFELTETDIRFLQTCESYYNLKLSSGLKKEQARYFLPNGLKTEIVMTLNLRSWRNFLKLRTHKTAHPEIRTVANMLLKNLKERIPIVFDDIK